MLGSGFLTAAIGEPLVTVGWPARPAGRGEPEAVRPGDSCDKETETTLWSQTKPIQQRQNRTCTEKVKSISMVCHLSCVKTLTVAPLVGVAGCFANID